MRAVRLLRYLGLVLLLLAGPASRAQFTGSSATSAPGLNVRQPLTTDPAILFPSNREMRLMTGDLVRVTVYGVQPGYTDTERISLDGSIRLNLLGVINLDGLPVKEAEQAVAARFEQEETFHNAQVQIELVEGPGHTATIIGAARGTVPIVGGMRLYDVLARIGGLPANASTVLTIERPGEPAQIVVDIGNDAAHNNAANIPIFTGDTITVGQVGFIYVVGAVNRPGATPLIGAIPTTVVQAVTAAGGTNFAAKPNDSKLVRITGNQRTVINLPLQKILDGKAEDIPLQSDDIILVPSSALRNAIRNGGITTIIAIAFSLISLTIR